MDILYVDDDIPTLELAKVYFTEINKNMRLETVDSAMNALELLKNRHFDAILSDYQMPVVDGLEFLKRIRNEKIDIPFILFTGKGREEVAINALNLGADGYFKKGDGDPNSQFTLLIKELKDKIDLYKTKQALIKSEREKSLILENVPVSISLLDPDLNIIWTNRSDIKFIDKPHNELIGTKCYQSWFKTSKMCENCPAYRSLNSKEIEDSILITSDGSHWLLKGIPILNDNKKVIGVIETAINLTEMNKTYCDAVNNNLPILKQILTIN